jgi:phosphoribosyl 1,2-cyclic phosphodiesterase
MRVTFWGVRGSFPVAHPKVTRVGGNTSCVAVEAEGQPLLVFDAGTGIRNLGRLLKKGSPFADGAGTGTICFSHTHWDHIQGFMYFEPFFRKGNKFTVVARADHDLQLKNVFQGLADRRYFPYSLDALKAEVAWKPVGEEDTFRVGGWKVSTVRLNHPGLAIGYKVELGGKSFIYMTDTAPWGDRSQLFGMGFHVKSPGVTDPEEQAELLRYGQKLEQFVSGSTVLLYDTFFTQEQYAANPHWGHSTAEEGIRLARQGNVPRFYLFHHSPESWDDELEARARTYQKTLGGSDLAIDVAREGESIEV